MPEAKQNSFLFAFGFVLALISYFFKEDIFYFLSGPEKNLSLGNVTSADLLIDFTNNKSVLNSE